MVAPSGFRGTKFVLFFALPVGRRIFPREVSTGLASGGGRYTPPSTPKRIGFWQRRRVREDSLHGRPYGSCRSSPPGSVAGLTDANADIRLCHVTQTALGQEGINLLPEGKEAGALKSPGERGRFLAGNLTPRNGSNQDPRFPFCTGFESRTLCLRNCVHGL